MKITILIIQWQCLINIIYIKFNLNVISFLQAISKVQEFSYLFKYLESNIIA